MELDNEWEDFLNGKEIHFTPELCDDLGEAPECEELYISTKTKLLYLNQSNIDVAHIFWSVPIVEYWKPQEVVIKKQMQVCHYLFAYDFVKFVFILVFFYIFVIIFFILIVHNIYKF
jgi:hypothetical protein